jgi:hypothetical protein
MGADLSRIPKDWTEDFTNNATWFNFIKSLEGLSLHTPEGTARLIPVIGGSEISKGPAVSEMEQPPWVGRGCNWASAFFLLAVAMVFSGVAGNWFSAEHAGGGLLFRFLQLATGSVAMGLAVAVPSSLLFGRNPIRWGMGMPILVYAGGVLMALVAGRAGISGLILGAPLYLGFAIAAGVMGAFLIDGIFSRPRSV